jgi:hypothetical protein
MSSEQERIWRVGDGKWDNDESIVTNAGTTCKYYFMATGADSSDDGTKIYIRYFSFGRGANHINLRPSGVVTITQAKLRNGDLINFKKPITVQTTGYSKDFAAEIEYLIIVTQAAGVNVMLEAC